MPDVILHPTGGGVGITVPKALADFLVLDAIYKTDACIFKLKVWK